MVFPNVSPSSQLYEGCSNGQSPLPQEHPLSVMLKRQCQLHQESEFDSEKILKQSRYMRNKMRSILGKLKKTM
jgi:hypothetical protein